MLGPPQCQIPGCLHNLRMAKLALLSRAVGVKTVGCPKITADTNADKAADSEVLVFTSRDCKVCAVRTALTGTDASGAVCESSHLMTATANLSSIGCG